MLGLNYYNSAFDAAPNGIGATIMVRDGGGGYRRLVKNFGVWTVLHIYGKVNGCGADLATNIVQGAGGLAEYIDPEFAGLNPWMSMASTSTQGLLRLVCKISEVSSTAFPEALSSSPLLMAFEQRADAPLA